ncbi:hypothetical protein JCM5353_001155 [Sporobolomyces roseus]
MDPPPIAGPSSPSLAASSSAQISSTQPLASTSSLQAQDYSPYLLQPTNSHPSSLSGTQDLITLFQLDTLYNTFLRPYLPPPSTSSTNSTSEPLNADSPIPIKGAVSLKGKEKAIVGSPAPQIVASPAPGGGTGGFKITLGGIKFGSSGGGASGISMNGDLGASSSGTSGKVKRIKMEKNYTHLVSDIPGRNSIKKDQYLTHLIMNPDPQSCPPLLPPEEALLREGLTLKPGGLAGFDMSVWESGTQGPGDESRKKKKKRKIEGDTGQGGGGGSGKKQKQ